MEEDIKILEDKLKLNVATKFDWFGEKEFQALENIIKEYKQKDKDNNDLRKLYRRTAAKLRENGKEELADYFLAQINEVPTFTVDDDIDYYEEYYKQKEKIKELEGMLKNRIKYTNELEKDLFENCANYVISKSKIKEKLKEIEKQEVQELKGLKGQDRYYIKQKFIYKKSILEELLEEK